MSESTPQRFCLGRDHTKLVVELARFGCAVSSWKKYACRPRQKSVQHKNTQTFVNVLIGNIPETVDYQLQNFIILQNRAISRVLFSSGLYFLGKGNLNEKISRRKYSPEFEPQGSPCCGNLDDILEQTTNDVLPVKLSLLRCEERMLKILDRPPPKFATRLFLQNVLADRLTD